MKKTLLAISGFLSVLALCSCGKKEEPKKTEDYVSTLTEAEQYSFYDFGYVNSNGGMTDYTKYYNTDSYVKVSTADDFIKAISDAKVDYTNTLVEQKEFDYMVRNNVRKNETNWKRALTKGLYLKDENGNYNKIPVDTPWDPNDKVYTASLVYYEDSAYPDVTYSQTLNKESKVHVIEITNDINLSYKEYQTTTKETYSNILEKWDYTKMSKMTPTKWYNDNPVSRISIENTSDLLIYSKNGAKLTCAGFKVNYCKNIAIRNLEFDELWQWEDFNDKNAEIKLGDYDTVGWAYFKIGYSENILIDHCKFGKSFDGQIDVANTYYESLGTYQNAPYGATGGSAVSISFCDFSAGSDDKDGYIYKMMQRIEDDYKNGGGMYQYYNALRDIGLSFEDILYGIAIPQKKGFLLGDSGTDVKYNKELRVSFSNCKFTNIEDRLPKVRTGEVVMYNCIVDNNQYMEYRTKLRAIGNYGTGVNGLQRELQNINKAWKCALVSQGIVCGNGGSFYASNVIYRGIEQFLKNNDEEITNNTGLDINLNGTYKLVNCSYQANKDSDVVLMTDGLPSQLSNLNVSQSKLTSNFKWRTDNELSPFEIKGTDLNNLESLLSGSIGVGTNNKVKLGWLKTSNK